MAIITCPHCRQQLEVAAAPQPGSRARCYLCKEIFVAPAPQQRAPQPRPSQPMPRPAAPAQPQPASPYQTPTHPGALQNAGMYQQPYSPPPLQNMPLPSGFQQAGTPDWVGKMTLMVGGSAALLLITICALTISKSFLNKSGPPAGAIAAAPEPVAAPVTAPVAAPVIPSAAKPVPVPLPTVPTVPAVPTAPPSYYTGPSSPPSPPSTSPTNPAQPPPDQLAVNNPPANVAQPPGVDASGDSDAPEPLTSVELPKPAPKPVESDDDANIAGSDGKMKYRWRNGARYEYNFKLRVDHGAAKGTESNGMVAYVPNAAETAIVKKILGQEKGQEGTGTAFVVHTDGILVTCDHVVRGASRIDVTLKNRKMTARVLARDAKNDLAILKVGATDLPSLPIGNSGEVRMLQDVYAVGFPLSDVLGSTVKATPGTIAGMVEMERQLLQLNAGINPGNSGGPLLNTQGEVIGICSAKLVGDSVSNVGFAVPTVEVQKLLKSSGLSCNGQRDSSLTGGSAIAERAALSVAYVQVTIGPDNKDLQVMSFTGFSSEGAGRINNVDGHLLATVRGDSIAEKGDSVLPGFVGTFATMVMDKLPEIGEKRWETSKVSSIAIEASSDSGIPSAYGRTRSRLGGYGSRTEMIIAPLIEKTNYKLGERKGNIQIIHKKHVMQVQQAQSQKPLYSSTGDGIIRFDAVQGIPLSGKMDYVFVRKQGTTEIRVPISFTYELGAKTGHRPGDEGLNMVKRAEEMEKNRDRSEEILALVQTLNQLSPSDTGAGEPLNKLQNIPTSESLRSDVAKAVDRFLTSKQSTNRFYALMTIKKWGTEENVPSLNQLVESLDTSSRNSAIEALGFVSRSPETAIKLSQLLGDAADYHYAVRGLKAMGPAAEDAVLAFLKSTEEEAPRRHALSVLQSIGTRKSYDTLQGLVRNKSNTSISYAAEAALREITERVKGDRG